MLATVVSLIALTFTAPAQDQAGPLFFSGGGEMSQDVVKSLLALSRGADTRVVVIPHTARRAHTGKEAAKIWKDAGVKKVTIGSLRKNKVRTTKKALEKADLVWLPRGSAVELMKQLKAAKMVDPIRAAHRRGAIVGGAGSGAAVIPKVMMTGEDGSRALRKHATELDEGMGLVLPLIVDQYFSSFRRFNRLLTAMMDFPEQIGVGIDEETAILVQGDSFEVLGASCAVVIDATEAKQEDAQSGDPLGATGVKVHVLRKGMRYDFAKRSPIR